MSTEIPLSEPSPASDLTRLEAEVDAKDKQIEELQEDLNAERDARREDRFFFIFSVVILLDIVFFSVLDSIGGPISLLVLELVVFISLARRMGIEELQGVFSRVLGRIADGIATGEQ